MRILALLTDAYGGRGGIAQHNRHLLDALCSAPGVTEVVVLPRVIVEAVGTLPDGLSYRTEAAGSKTRFAVALLNELARPGRFDVVVCGHLNLLPFGVLARLRYGARLIQIVHGIDAWNDPGAFKRRLVRFVDRLVSVSDFTRRKVQAWAKLPEKRTVVIPNAVDLSAFTPGPKRADLLERYGLQGKTVLLTVARLAGRERYKGFDEVMEVLPLLRTERPEIAYLIVGDGDDRARLDAKARALGISDHVVFAGYVEEDEKADHYRLADVFVMPGKGEGFGIVYLEALACGVPVVASTADASREAVLDGALGELADPDVPASIVSAIGTSLARPHVVPRELDLFSRKAFFERWRQLVASV